LEDRRTDNISSMSIFSSPVSMNIFWVSILEIIVTHNEKFLMRTSRYVERK
jgi:hypothetical protein